MLNGISCSLALLVLCGFGPGAAGAQVPPDEILRLAQAQRPAFIKSWEALVNLDTGTGHGPGLAQAEAILVERLAALGAEVEVTPAGPSVGNNIAGILRGTGETDFLLMIHYDTVFPPGEAARRPFRTDEVHAYGPGVADAKGGIAIILHSVKMLQDLNFNEYRTLTVFFNPDEEKGSLGSRDRIAELARQHDYVFSYEPPDSEAVTITTNGINYVFLNVTGRASHAGAAPEEGRNAIIELAHQLLQLDDLGDPEKGTTVNWTMVKGGEARNIIPSSAAAEGDMRYSDPGEYDRVLADAERLIENRLIADTEVEFRMERARPPLPRNDASQELAALAVRLYHDIGRDLEPIAMRFGTDAAYAYMPDSAKPKVLETVGIVGSGLHSPEEFAVLSSIEPRLYLTVRMIMELSQPE